MLKSKMGKTFQTIDKSQIRPKSSISRRTIDLYA